MQGGRGCDRHRRVCALHVRVLVMTRKRADDDDTHTCTPTLSHTYTQFDARVAAGKARAEISCQMNPSLPGCPY